MNPGDWEKVQELYARACEIAPAEREELLEREAAEAPEVVEGVRRLLELKPPSRFIEPVSESPRADRYFGGGMEGTRLGDFLLERELGRGGMGVVYGAVQLGLDRHVAVKVLPLASLGRSQTLERFRREAKAATRLQHPRIVDVLAYGEEDRTAWFAMRWVDGHDLAVEIEHQLDPAERSRCLLPISDDGRYLRAVAERVAELADAVEHAHQRGVVHRDIKPQNILLDREGRMNLADFGLAKSEAFGALSRTAEVRGTPHYMSPEQVRALRGGVDHRTDVYSLGVVLYELLARRRPFQAETPVLVMHAITHDEPRRPSAIDDSVPRELETICLRAMEKRADDRYASAAALADDLRRFVRDEPILARPPSTFALVRRRIARHARTASAVGAGGLAVVSTLATVLWLQDRADDVRLRVDLESEVDPEGARVIVVELDPDFHARLSVREVGRWPVGWVRLEPGVYRLAIELADFGMAEADFELREPGISQRRKLRLRPRGEVVADMLPVTRGSVLTSYPVYSPDGAWVTWTNYVHEVSDVLLDVLPVTNRSYAAFVDETGRSAPPEWPGVRDEAWLDKPVVGLRLDEAQAYAEHVGKRLPTRAEVQLASRAWSGSRFPWGDEPGPWLDRLQLEQPELGTDLRFLGETSENRAEWYARFIRAVGLDPEGTRGPFGHGDLFGNVVVWTCSPEVRIHDGQVEADPVYVHVGGVPAFRSRMIAARDGLDDRITVGRFTRSMYVGLRCATSADHESIESLPIPQQNP
ncbi:MAG TPA: bifunctional serine/threonine-protein kinase/formylglycine-generating enzyme family protein [Planctomycetota bacterium]|nr:bifunctional serine/threonine-protein kinase/formylglycine-generating enzyme family protein [Planctomycetota bacterium]